MFVPRQCVDAMKAGLAPCVTSDRATRVVTSTDNAKMALACAHKDGMADIVLCVSCNIRIEMYTTNSLFHAAHTENIEGSSTFLHLISETLQF